MIVSVWWIKNLFTEIKTLTMTPIPSNNLISVVCISQILRTKLEMKIWSEKAKKGNRISPNWKESVALFVCQHLTCSKYVWGWVLCQMPALMKKTDKTKWKWEPKICLTVRMPPHIQFTLWIVYYIVYASPVLQCIPQLDYITKK